MDSEDKGSWISIVVGMLTTIVVLAFARLAYGVVLPYMRDGLALTFKQAGFLGTVSSLGYLGAVLFAGIVAAKIGGKNTILVGISAVAVGFAGLAFTSTYHISVAFMLLLGVGTAFTYTNLISIITAWFPKTRGLVIGLISSGVGVGVFLNGIIVPYLSRIYPREGWRLTWGLFCTISLFVVILTVLFIKNPPDPDLTRQNMLPTPLRDIYTNGNLIMVSCIYALVGLTYIVQSVFTMSFMLNVGIAPNLAGQIVALNGGLSVFAGPAWGFVSDRIGRRFSLTLTMTLTMLGTFLPVLFPTLPAFLAQALILGLVVSGLFALVQATSMEQVAPLDMPLAFSFATFFFALGQFIGPAVAGWLIEDLGGFKAAFLFTSIALLIGVILTLRIRAPKPGEVKQVAL